MRDKNYILHRFEKVQGSGNQYKARCKAHDDENPSLSIGFHNPERTEFNCFAGCKRSEILAAAGLTEGDVSLSPNGKSKIIVEYGYSDENGELLYQKVRYFPKEFKLRQPSGTAGWRWSLEGVRRVLYHLPAIKQAIKEGEEIWIPEGEKDVDNLIPLGLIATTNVEGAADEGHKSKWRKEYTEQLRGAKRINILFDNDKAGRTHAQAIAKALADVVPDVRIVELPELKEKQDISDWLAAGHTIEELRQLADQTKSVNAVEPFDFSEGYTLDDIWDKEFPEIKWAVPGMVPEGAAILASPPKTKKSFMALSFAIAKASGGKALNLLDVEQSSVLYLALEDGQRRIKKRSKSIDSTIPKEARKRIHFFNKWPKADEGGLEAIEQYLNDHRDIAFVVLDVLECFRPESDGKKPYRDDYRIVRVLDAIGQKYHVAILILHHTHKIKAGAPVEDFIAEISGTYGLVGAATAALVIKSERTKNDATLCVTGRDIEKEGYFAIRWDSLTTSWRLLGDADEFRFTPAQQAIIDALREIGAASPIDISRHLYSDLVKGSREFNNRHKSVRDILGRLTEDGKLCQNHNCLPSRCNCSIFQRKPHACCVASVES